MNNVPLLAQLRINFHELFEISWINPELFEHANPEDNQASFLELQREKKNWENGSSSAVISGGIN